MIDNAKKGSIIDSAYGYKDAVGQYYAERTLEDSSFKLNDNYYLVEDDGNLLEMDLDNKEYVDVHNIDVEGTKPSGGYFEYSNGTIKSGCLVFDEYKVTIEDGKMISSEKGTCNSISLTACDSPNFITSSTDWFKFDETTGTLTGIYEKDDEHPNGWNGETEVTIPCKINGVDVVTLSEVFAGAGVISSVTIPDTVKTIKNGSFYGNNLRKINFGQNVETINGGAFNSESNVPNFEGRKIIFPDSLKKIGSAFSNGANIIADEIIFGKNLEIIENCAFNKSIILKVIFRGGKNAVIHDSAFFGSTINEIIFNDGINTIKGGSFNSVKNLKRITFPSSLKIIDMAFQFCSNLEEVTFKNGIDKLSNGAFASSKVKKIVLPDSLKVFGNGVLVDTPIEEITFGTGIETIDNNFLYSSYVPQLSIIHNNSGKSFDWNDILGNASSEPFETGTVTRSDGSVVTIIKD